MADTRSQIFPDAERTELADAVSLDVGGKVARIPGGWAYAHGSHRTLAALAELLGVEASDTDRIRSVVRHACADEVDGHVAVVRRAPGGYSAIAVVPSSHPLASHPRGGGRGVFKHFPLPLGVPAGLSDADRETMTNGVPRDLARVRSLEGQVQCMARWLVWAADRTSTVSRVLEVGALVRTGRGTEALWLEASADRLAETPLEETRALFAIPPEEGTPGRIQRWAEAMVRHCAANAIRLPPDIAQTLVTLSELEGAVA